MGKDSGGFILGRWLTLGLSLGALACGSATSSTAIIAAQPSELAPTDLLQAVLAASPDVVAAMHEICKGISLDELYQAAPKGADTSFLDFLRATHQTVDAFMGPDALVSAASKTAVETTLRNLAGSSPNSLALRAVTNDQTVGHITDGVWNYIDLLSTAMSNHMMDQAAFYRDGLLHARTTLHAYADRVGIRDVTRVAAAGALTAAQLQLARYNAWINGG